MARQGNVVSVSLKNYIEQQKSKIMQKKSKLSKTNTVQKKRSLHF